MRKQSIGGARSAPVICGKREDASDGEHRPPTPQAGGPTVVDAANDYLDSIRSPNTRRAYTTAVVKTADTVMGIDAATKLPNFGRLLAEVADDEIGEALESLWGESAVNTWNARRAAVLAWLAWCRERGYTAPSVPERTKRSTPPDSDTPVRSRTAIDRLISRRDVHIREKTL